MKKLACSCRDEVCAKWHPLISKAIKEEIEKARVNGEKFSLNMAKLAKSLGVSRPTLYVHEAFIDEILKLQKAKRRRADGYAAVNVAEERLQEVLAELELERKRLEGFRVSMAKILRTLPLHRSPIEALVAEELGELSNALSECALCQSKIVSPVRDSNLVRLADRRDN